MFPFINIPAALLDHINKFLVPNWKFPFSEGGLNVASLSVLHMEGSGTLFRKSCSYWHCPVSLEPSPYFGLNSNGMLI